MIWKIKILLSLSFICFIDIYLFGQTNIVNHEQFNTNPVPTVPGSWAAGSWNLYYNYATNCHDAPSEPNTASIAGGTYNSYFWIPVTFKNGYKYDVNIWRKNGSNMNVVFNETADLTTPLSTETVNNATTSWQNITFSSYTHAIADVSGYIGICATAGNGSRMYVDDITITETPPPCTYPSAQATMNAFTNIQSDRVTINWNRGTGGDKVLVVGKKSSAPSDPTDAGNYTANSIFGSGSLIGASSYVVYDGTGTSVTVTELDASSNYYFNVYEYKTTGPCYKVPGASGNTTTIRSTKYYVNDNSTTGDIYCSVVGDNAKLGTRPSIPKLNLSNLLSTYAGTFLSGDTIYVDKGAYTENDLSSPVGGVVIKGAGMDKTTFTKSGSDHYFMVIDDNNTVLQDMFISGYDATTASGTGKALEIVGVTGIKILNVQVNSVGAGSGSMPIQVKSNSTVLFNGGGSTCNKVSSVSGGINITGSSVDVTIKNYLFIDNSSSPNGSAIKMTGGAANQKVVIRNSKFVDNKNSTAGSAIYMSSAGGDLKVYDCIFDNNDGNGTSEIIYGNAISIQGGSATIKRCEIKNSSSTNTTHYGGGIAGYGAVNNVTLTIDSTTFSSNTSSNGNDIYIKESGSSVTANVFNCTFSSGATNITQAGSGAITISDSGNPSTSGTVTKTNTNAPTYTANPSTPIYSGSCATSVAITATPLPIKLLYFKANTELNNINISWQTATEINNDYFTLEKSEDGINFYPLSIIKGAGNSNEILNYNYIDFHPNDINYYRLKQTDFDGKYTYSNIIFVSKKQNENTNYHIYYSNISDEIIIKTLNSNNKIVQLIDFHGRQILNQEFENNYIKISCRNINDRSVVVVNILSNFNSYSKKILINKD